MAYSLLDDDVLARRRARSGCYCRCVIPEPGPVGPPGPQGPPGPRGPRGFSGAGVTSNCMAAYAYADGEISLAPGGVQLELPVHEVLDCFAVNDSDTVFTVPANGVYQITYGVNLTAAASLSSYVTRNNVPINGLVVSPGTARSRFGCQTLTKLDAGDKLSLVLSASGGSVTLDGGVGAYLNIVRVL